MEYMFSLLLSTTLLLFCIHIPYVLGLETTFPCSNAGGPRIIKFDLPLLLLSDICA